MPATETPSEQATTAELPSISPRAEEIIAAEPRNILVLALHYIVLRLAWIFKTETVIMPAFLDTIAGAGWLRGCLPILNRLGQGVPPMILADRLRNTRYKKRALFATSLLMAVPFLILGVLWFSLTVKRQIWLPAVFLALYAAFFAATGLNQLSFGTLQGKLIRADRRGRLLGISGIIGSITCVTFGWFLLQYWLGLPDGGFGYIFTFTGVGFVVAGFCGLAANEPADESRPETQKSRNHLHSAWKVFRDDRAFRRAAVVGMLFITIQLLFPHFQALGRRGLAPESQGFQLMLWIISQNAAVGIFSLMSGLVADRFGNRLAMRIQVFLIALTPPLALLMASPRFAVGGQSFWIAFCLLGLTPVTMKTIINYTLELAEPDDHPRYVSTMSLCLAVPIFLGPLFGELVDVLGFEAVFSFVTVLIFLSGVLTFRMHEPRHDHRQQSASQ